MTKTGYDIERLQNLAAIPVWAGSDSKTALAILAAFGERQALYMLRYAGKSAKSYSIQIDVNAYMISTKPLSIDELTAEHKRGSTEAEMIESAIEFLSQDDG